MDSCQAAEPDSLLVFSGMATEEFGCPEAESGPAALFEDGRPYLA
jgi:hypothetical protein